MLVVEENSVYEIDESCVKRRGVSKECAVYEKLAGKADLFSGTRKPADSIADSREKIR